MRKIKRVGCIVQDKIGTDERRDDYKRENHRLAGYEDHPHAFPDGNLEYEHYDDRHDGSRFDDQGDHDRQIEHIPNEQYEDDEVWYTDDE